jgi:hypothetical protein
MNKKVNVLDKNEDGSYVFGEGPLVGWVLESTGENKDKGRDIRNALLRIVERAAARDYASVEKILSYRLNGKTVCGAICETLTLYAMGGGVAKAAAKAASDVVGEASRTIGKPSHLISRAEADEEKEKLASIKGFRPRLVCHHNNGTPAMAYLWNDNTGRNIGSYVYEEAGDGMVRVLDHIPAWACAGGNPQYAEERAYVSDRDDGTTFYNAEPSPAVVKLFEECTTDTVQQDIDKEMARSKSKRGGPSYVSSPPEQGGRNPFSSGQDWFEKACEENEVVLGVARRAKNGLRPCVLCGEAGGIQPGDRFVKRKTGSRRAHESCWKKRRARAGISA